MAAQSEQKTHPSGSRKALAFFILLCFALSFLPIFLPNVYCIGFGHDEGLFLVIAKEIAAGKTLYLDITDNKLPLLYFSLIPATFACGSNFVCYRTISMGINFLIALIIFASCRHYLKGLVQYAPSLAYLVYSIVGMNFFIGTEQILLFMWAISFFAISEFLAKPRNSMLLLLGFMLGTSFMIKPTAPLVLALPLIYIFLHEKNKKQMLLWIFGGFFATVLLLALILFPFVYLPGLLLESASWLPGFLPASQTYEALAPAAPFIETFPFYLNQLEFFLMLALLICVPALPVLFQKNRTKLETICCLFLLSAIAAIASKTFALSIHAGLFPVLFLPLSLLIGSLLERMLSDSKFIPAPLIIAAFLALIAISLFTISPRSASREMLTLSTFHSECGWAYGAVSYLQAHANGTFFVFPSRAGYYLILNKEPQVRVLSHAQIAFTLPKSDAWFEKNVFAPIRSSPPGTILLFDEPFDERSGKGENLKYNEFRAFISQNYELAYNYSRAGDYAVKMLVYEKK